MVISGITMMFMILPLILINKYLNHSKNIYKNSFKLVCIIISNLDYMKMLDKINWRFIFLSTRLYS